eukprot:gene27026-32658_t
MVDGWLVAGGWWLVAEEKGDNSGTCQWHLGGLALWGVARAVLFWGTSIEYLDGVASSDCPIVQSYDHHLKKFYPDIILGGKFVFGGWQMRVAECPRCAEELNQRLQQGVATASITTAAGQQPSSEPILPPSAHSPPLFPPSPPSTQSLTAQSTAANPPRQEVTSLDYITTPATFNRTISSLCFSSC